MKTLKAAINNKGMVKSPEILDVSKFLNGEVDANLMSEIGRDFADHFQNLEFDLIVTVESSGIAPSVFASLFSGKPLVIIKKHTEIKDASYVQQGSYSFTKNQDYYLTSKKELIENKRIILIDDFLAAGSVVENVNILVERAGSKLVGVGICITKGFQSGYKLLNDKGYNLYSQVIVESMDPTSNTVNYLD